MKILGIVAEYNPFHNGHKYHIEKSLEITGATHTVAVMSSNFVQRGQASVCDKWSRAKMAVLNGIDLVLELPSCFSVRSAEYFAKNAIFILNSLGVVDYLSFGSESGKIEHLYETARLLVENEDTINKKTKEFLKDGLSHATAREYAMNSVLKVNNLPVNTPNNILGVEYIKALIKQNSNIKPVTVARFKAGYFSIVPADGFASASYLRELILKGEIKKINDYVPQSVYEIITNEIAKGKCPVSLTTLNDAIIANLRKMTVKEIENICDVNEGLEQRIKKAAGETHLVNELIDIIKTKRYAQSRIERIITNSFLGLTKDYSTLFPSYIKVLALNRNGREILRAAKSASTLPIVNRFSDIEDCDKAAQYEIKASNIYSLMYSNPNFKISGLDYTTSPFILKDKFIAH